MKLQKQKPRQTLNPAFRRQRPSRTEINLFKQNLLTLIGKVDESESEEHVKNLVRDFLRDTYYKATHEVNTKGRQDLAIYTGKTNESKVGVIIEAKRPKNSAEWFKGDNANCKAFQELVLYYLRERENLKNIDIKYLVATNIYEWYIIEASYFENLFFKDKDFLKDFVEFDKKQKITTNTDLFYNSIARPFIDSIDKTIPCGYFNIKDFDKALRNNDKKEDAHLIALIKILSPSHLLKLEFADDSNSLKESFYKELLHIIGLEERKESGKYIIDRKKEEQRNEGSLIENAINMLETENPLHKIADLSLYGTTREERIYNIALELCITWINRILFLKLLEGQLQNYHQKNPEYLFLNSEMIPNYDELHKLFHQVLAKTNKERTASVNEKYKRVPYLNSSLFDISKLEDGTIQINSLDNDYKLELIPSTVLKEIKKKNQGLPALDYLFRFLNAFDFSSEGGEEIQEDENRTLINASVLGKVFEKINGYKEGSIYTPGFITMYICSKAIRAAVVQKFKDEYNWKIEHFTDLRNYLKDRRTVREILADNALINSIRLCDPAVGSGHFLVSSLNEIIAIKSELGLLADKRGDRLSDYQIVIAQDELIVTDQSGNDFKYEIRNGKPLSKEMQRLQKALFEEKQTIIENCLFGVDINPNSVKICGLRLWIELLKNAYYKDETNFKELETLPNIDINIKCSNSLISRFPLNADLKKALKNIKYNIEDYKRFVNDYKNAKGREEKRKPEEIIDEIKTNFKINIDDPFKTKISRARGEVTNILSELNRKEQWGEKIPGDFKTKLKKAKQKLTKLEEEKEDILNSIIYKNAFEWRFEFPEVLDSKGNFEGFDIVVGNPPYVFGGNEGISHSHKKYFKENYISGSGKINLFNLFIEKGFNVLKQKGEFAFIIPNTFLRVTSYHESRKLLIDNFRVNAISDFGANVFAEATTTAIVLSATKISPLEDSTIEISNGEAITNTLLQSALKLNYVIALNVNSFGQGLTNKMRIESVPLGEICKELIFGVVITKNKDEVVSNIPKKGWKPFLEGRDIGRYFVKPVYQYLNYQPDLLHRARTKAVFEVKEKLLIQRITGGSQPIKVAYDDRQIYNKESINNLILKDDSPFNIKYILSLLNSKVINWFYNSQFTNESTLTVNIAKEYLSQIPIKNASPDKQKLFASIVDYIIFSKSIQDQLFPSFFERLIDALVYEMYLPEVLKNANCEVLKHLTELPHLEVDNDERNLKTVERIYKELSDPKHPVSAALLKLLNVEEVNIIEGRT